VKISRNLSRALVILGAGAAAAFAEKPPALRSIPLPGGNGGIGFDDVSYSETLRRFLVPAGRSGNLDLVDPETNAVTLIPGFTATSRRGEGHEVGVTSVSEGAGLIFATDRSTRRIDVVDPALKTIVASASLSSDPDYVRFVPARGEVWVTEPEAERIEIFELSAARPPGLTRAGSIPVKGGPESLVIDPAAKRAYTNLWRGTTAAIGIDSRRMDARWNNGCNGSRGLALDRNRNVLFVGCAEGAAAALSTKSGRTLGRVNTGEGVDIIAFDPRLSHLYVPAARTGEVSIIGVGKAGELSSLGKVSVGKGVHGAASDGRGRVLVCDPDGGRVVIFRDSYPAAGK
jgi:DNA-binding beta-propeller fold protein YncE